MRFRPPPGLASLFTLALAAAAAAAPAPRPAAPSPISLAVVVSVDGLSWDRLAYYRPWYVAGLKRLLDESQVETGCRYRHINTETGPGHSSLSTGAPPRVSGIVANRWFEQKRDGTIRAVQAAFPDAPGVPGSSQSTAIAGPGNLRVPTLGDRLVVERPGARVVSLSAKDRSAILLAGRDRRHSVYWYDLDTGVFATSSAYDGDASARTVADAFNAGLRLPTQFGFRWDPLPVSEAVA